MLIFLYLTKPKSAATGAIVLQALFIIVLLIVFMYGMDTLLYRSYQKRQAKKTGGTPPKTK
jgi:high-affinity K+ transport system ATPase subunit B